MDRKVYVEVKVRLIIRMDEGIDVGDVVADCDYNFISHTPGADIEDMEIRDIEVQDSK
jgi:hypothetical protein